MMWYGYRNGVHIRTYSDKGAAEIDLGKRIVDSISPCPTCKNEQDHPQGDQGEEMTHPDNRSWVLTEKDGTEYQLVDGWLFRHLPGASGWVPAYGYEDHKHRKGALQARRASDK